MYPEDGTENSASQFTPSTKFRQLVSKNEKAQCDNGQRLDCNSRQAEIPCSTRLPAVVCDPAGSQATFKDGIGYTPSVQTRTPETSCSAIGIIRNSHGHYLELAVTSECLSERLFVRVSRRPISSAHEGRKSPIWLTLCGFRGPLMKAKRYSFWRRM